MATSTRRQRTSTRTGIAIASVVSLALGAVAVVGPGAVNTQATAAEFTGGLRGDDGQGAVEKQDQKASDLDTGGNKCTVSASPEPGGGSQAGFTWHTLEPSQVSKDKTQWGLSVAFDNSKDRTFADWSFSNSGRFGELLNAGTVPAMAAGQTLPFDKGPVTAKADESIDITASRTQRNLNLAADLTEDEVKQFAQAGADNPVRYAWQGNYTKDNILSPFATRGDNAAFTAVVNPWPSENMECNPITVNWESFDKHVIVEGEETKVGHINIPALDEDSQGQDDSLSRMVVEAYDDNGKFIGTSNAKESGGSQRLRVDEKGDIYFTWPKYRGTDLAADKNVNFSVIALPRSVDQLKAAVENNNGYGDAFDSSNSLTRYNKPNVIDSKGFRLDDTEDHTPRYDQNEKKIISGVDGPRGPVNTGRQTVTFTQVPDLLKELAKKKADGGFEATVELDDTYVLEGWDVEMDEDYNVTVTSPENPMPNTFARPKITVEYSNGSTDEIQLFVLVDPNNTQVTDLVRPAVAKGLPNQEITSQIGTKPIMRGRKPVFPEKFEVDQSTVPEGWTVTVDPTGKVTAVAAYNEVPLGTTISPTVKATYPDQTTDEVEVRFQVIATIKVPDYDRVTDRPGKAVTLTPTLPEKGLSGSETDQPPYRYSFANGELEYTVEDDSGTWHLTIDEDTGEITTTIPRTAPEGYILDVPVHTFYRVGETKMVPVTATITVLRSDIVPVYPVESTGPNEPVEHKVKDAPRGSTFSFGDLDGQPLLTKEEDGWTYSIDPKTGVVTATPPADSKPGDKKTITVKVATPDGSTPEVPVTTVVKLSNSWEAEPTYQAETVYPGETATLPVHFDNPDNAKLAKDKPFKLGDVPAGWDVSIDDEGTITATAPKDAKNGDVIDIPVTVTYEDGSTDTTTAKVTVIDVLEREIPFNTVYKYDPTVNQGTYQVETEGKPGKETLNKDRTWKRVEDPVDEVVVIGTKPMSEKVEWTEPIPYSTVIRENPNLAPGEVKVVQEGSNGEASYAAVFNGVNGEATVTETKARTEPTDRIVEHGPRLKDQELVTETTRKIPFETTIVFDDTLAAGEQVVDKQGVVGEEKVTSTQKLVDGKPSGDPVVQTTTVTEKQDAVIRVGTKTTGTNTETVKSEVPFGVKIEFDPNMAAGTSEVTTPGVPGEKTVTIKRDITNSQPGDPQITEEITKQPVDQVIKVGTKPSEASSKVTWTAQVPFEVETRPNPELKPGEIKVVQKGVPGEKTYTADFTATGDQATVTPEEKQTKDPVNEIIEYGPKADDTSVVTKTEKPVPFETEIVFDHTLAAGEQKVDQQGENGTEVVTSTQKIVDGKPSGDPEVTTERTKEPVKQIIRVGTKTTGTNTETVETEVPFGVKIELDPEMPAGESKVTQEGKPGKKKVTIEREIVNSQPGDPQISEEIIEQPVDQVIKVGTKQATATDKVTWSVPIPFSTVLRPNSELAPGETKVVQEGADGQATYEATFTGVNGEAKVTGVASRLEPEDRIIEYGPKAEVEDTEVVTKTETPVPFETKIIFDDTLEAGKQVVEKQGELGTEVVTSTQKIKGGKPDGEPTVTTERTKEPVAAEIRVGTKTEGTYTTESEVDVPFETEIIFDDALEAGKQETVQEGKPGKDKVTTTQTIVNSQVTGTNTETERVAEPVNKIIKVGTKGKPASTKIEWTETTPFEVEIRPNPELKPGETKVAQEGKPGEVKHTVTVNAENGEATTEDSVEKISDPVTHIIEVGPAKDQETELTDKSTQQIPFETMVEYDPNLEVGQVIEDQAGAFGEKETTKTWKLVNGQPVGEPETTEQTIKEPTPRKIRVGTKCKCEGSTETSTVTSTTKPTEPGEPSDPSDPSEPGEPGEPGDSSTTPTKPTEPTKPSDPTSPTEPTKPSQPTPVPPTTPGGSSGSSDPSGSGSGSSGAVAERCFGNAVRSPILWLLPIGLLASLGGKLIQPYLGQVQGQLDGLNAQINARVQEEMRRHGHDFDDHGLGGRVGQQQDRLNEQYGDQFGEIGRRVSEANAQLQGFVNDPMVQKLGQAAGLILALVAAGAVLYDWCGSPVGEAKTSIKGGGSSTPGGKEPSPAPSPQDSIEPL